MNNKHLGKIVSRAASEFHYQRKIFLEDAKENTRLIPALKSSIQLIAELIQNNQLTPCPRCEKAGISMGYVRRLDAAGSLDYEECPSCSGWTVISVEKENE